jgi:hypothetical protein
MRTSRPYKVRFTYKGVTRKESYGSEMRARLAASDRARYPGVPTEVFFEDLLTGEHPIKTFEPKSKRR